MAIFGFKTGAAVGLGAGYILGTRAGRERYLQIMDLWTKLRANKQVGSLVDKAMAMVIGPRNHMRHFVGNGLRSASDVIEYRSTDR
ncbi:MAG: hypothetical protein M3349_00400 [Actinomycetota bacterium]|nr:hypothetical protein [Actinomycetota bacterium]